MSDFDNFEARKMPIRFTAYPIILGILARRSDELSVLAAASAVIDGTDNSVGVNNNANSYGSLFFDNGMFPIELEVGDAGRVDIEPSHIVRLASPDHKEGDDPRYIALSVEFSVFKGGQPFHLAGDLSDDEIKERLDDEHPEALRVRNDIESNVYMLLVGPELPPTLVQATQLYQDPWLDAEVMQTANPHVIGDGDVAKLLDMVASAKTDVYFSSL